jgi:hypothetical protein
MSPQLANRLTLINQQLQYVSEHPRVQRDAQRRRHGREPALESLRVPESKSKTSQVKDKSSQVTSAISIDSLSPQCTEFILHVA